MKPARRQQGRGAFDLIEEATHVLRTAPAATLAVYYAGAVPFVLGLLYFWADMSRSPFANQHVVEAALGVGSLFLWMKCWQVIFARRVRAQIAAEPPPQLNLRCVLKIVLTQTIIQPLGLFVIPLALIPLIPAAWVYAFFQNVTALDGGEDGNAGKLFKKSWQQATLWPRQNHLVLAIASAFAFCVFLNWVSAGIMLPGLLKMLLGIETDFARSPWALLNTTFFAGMAGLTYLCVDPVMKTIYALRCFYGEALQSGEDLKAELKPFSAAVQTPAVMPTVLLVVLLAFSGAAPAKAAEAAAAPAPPVTWKISPPALDHAINQTIHERKYTWRMPRDKMVQPDADKGVLATFFEKIGDLFRNAARTVLDWLARLLQKLFHHRSHAATDSGASGYGWIMAVEVLVYALIAAAVAALVIFLGRVWRARRKPATVMAEAVRPAPDINDENVRADQLPEDGWMKLAGELLERGEFRLAMRAFYLASLAQLAARNLISIARFKSNRDYERELRRRAHALQNLPAVFGDNIRIFERIWYGRHEASRESVDQFAANVERMRAG